MAKEIADIKFLNGSSYRIYNISQRHAELKIKICYNNLSWFQKWFKSVDLI